MRLLVINAHHTVPDGADSYLPQITEWLKAAGHTCTVFAFDTQDMRRSPEAADLPPRGDDRAHAAPRVEHVWPWRARRAVGLFRHDETDDRFRRLIATTRPDAVYVVHLSGVQQPSLLRIAAREFRLPVVHLLSDYSLYCPSQHFLRDGARCTACLRHPMAAVLHRCVQHSAGASMLRVLQMAQARWNHWYDDVDVFLCPSQRLCDLLLQQGVSPARTRLTSFPAADMRVPCTTSTTSRRDYVLYCGRISPESGVDVLVRAFLGLGPRPESLILAGAAEPYYLDYLLDEGAGLGRRLRILPPQDLAARARLLHGARLVAHPSLWHENLPNNILEARAAGRGVMASRIGCLPHLVADRLDGWLVAPGKICDWADALETVLRTSDLGTIEARARERYLADHTPEQHVRQLVELFEHLIARRMLQRAAPSRRAAMSAA